MSALCRKRTFCAAAKERCYSITSSARDNSDCGTDMPSAFALEINDELTSGGKLYWQIGGFAPLSIPAL
jgi:hypothetical protein